MSQSTETVKAWAETVTIPTYGMGAPDKNPMFLEKRVYQGSSGMVYPYPVVDRVHDEKSDRPYTALFLENRYLRIMILPELGGRVQMALDKTNGYHFIYYNRVIKPALVGLTGPWISGGIEFNWPQHHRPSTFEPLNWRIVENPDQSRTVWCSEVERMFFTKGMHGFTLYPDRAYLEVSVQLYTRTSEPQTFLWWANPAVPVNDDYQSVFPPDVHAVLDHGRRDVSDFPIARGIYYKVNYAPGTDISRYNNIPAPTSYMAYHSDFDFVGDYDHGRQAGMMHVANHHLVPGKKQWTWGNADFGRAWDRQLTDEDGPYIELMCGAFTDNQPDFSWLMPGEEKRFTQVFMPYRQIGPPKNASNDALINLSVQGDTATLGVYVTRPRAVSVQLYDGDNLLWQKIADLSPELALVESIALPARTDVRSLSAKVLDAGSGQELVALAPLPHEPSVTPLPATAAKSPDEIVSNEELFLNGLHLEQYRHATVAPEPYYEEALRRDPFDSRCNNAIGLLLYRRGRFADAEPYFRKAIESLTRRNPNPYDGEPSYNLGLTLKMQGRLKESFDAFYKAAWNGAWQAATYFELARLASRLGDRAQALELANSTLRNNAAHHQARHLKIALLRQLERDAEARRESEIALALDPLDFGVLWEHKLLAEDDTFTAVLRGNLSVTIDVAFDYMHAGLWEDAAALLAISPQSDPMVWYFLATCYRESGDSQRAQAALERAAAAPADYCFPHRLECVPALQMAMEANPRDARAPYYLGNFWYAHRRQAEAIQCWERARDLDPLFATPHRNLGLAYFNQQHDAAKALSSYERAFALNPDDARVLFELDQLAKKLNYSPQSRLARLESYPELVERRDDLSIEKITLKNTCGRYADALAALLRRQFHPWEGGEGKTSGQYVFSLLEQAKLLGAAGKHEQAVERLQRALDFPHNLGEGRLPNALANDVCYYLGLAYEGLEDEATARAWFERAARGTSEPDSAMFYNDQPPDMIFYQGLAQQKLGQFEVARQIFQKLVDYGTSHLDDDVKLDYFAVSLPSFLVFDEDLNLRNRIHCYYMIGLGQLGLGNIPEAQVYFERVLALDASHQGAAVHRTFTATL